VRSPGAFRDATVDAGSARAVVAPEHAVALCAGHFPGDPVVPGASLAALAAEVAAELVAPAALAEVERCLFLRPVKPADEIVVSARALSGTRVDAEIRAGGVPAVRARFRFA
jgi:3-hydroxymyristoyl/3-hydroxydecanoyl-(acyl carrier protein) dehydratase